MFRWIQSAFNTRSRWSKRHCSRIFHTFKKLQYAWLENWFCSGNAELIGALARLKSYFDYGHFTPVQVAGIEALNNGDEYVEEICNMYKSRRDTLCDGLNSMGWEVEKPKATMFVWAKIPERFNMKSLEFSKILLEEANVAVSPGIGFGEYGDDFIRFSLIENDQRTKQALKNIKKLFK